MTANFQDYAERLKPLLDAGFTGHLAGLLGDAGSLQAYGGAKVLTGGKRIRGSLLCLVTSTLGGSLEDALPRAVAVELIQTATLIHDDFVDQHEQEEIFLPSGPLKGPERPSCLAMSSSPRRFKG